MRVKNRWFRQGRQASPEELAGAMAFIAWRIAENALRNMRRADFEVAVGTQYFAFLAEFLIFVVQVADRIAWQGLDEEARMQFTTTLAKRIAENLAENRQRLLGGDSAAAKADFIELLNQRAADYAGFEFDLPGDNFSFLRYLAHSVSAHLDEKDQHWVGDQIIAVEAPEAVATVDKAMRGLLDTEPSKRSARNATGGD